MKKASSILSFFLFILLSCNSSSDKTKDEQTITENDSLTKDAITRRIEQGIKKKHQWKIVLTNSNGVFLLDTDTKQYSPLIRGIAPVDYCFSPDSNSMYFLHINREKVEKGVFAPAQKYLFYAYTFQDSAQLSLIKTLTKDDLIAHVKKNTSKKGQINIEPHVEMGISEMKNIVLYFKYSIESEVNAHEGEIMPTHQEKIYLNPKTGKKVKDGTDIYIYKPEEKNEVVRFTKKIAASDSMLMVKLSKTNSYPLIPKTESYFNQQILFDVSPNALKVVYKVCTDYLHEEGFYALHIVNADGSAPKKISKNEEKYTWTPTDELIFKKYNRQTKNNELIMVKGLENNFLTIAKEVSLFSIINKSLYNKLSKLNAVEAVQSGKLSIAWKKENGFWQWPESIAETEAGNYAVLFTHTNGINSGFGVWKIDKNGKKLWDNSYSPDNATESGIDIFMAYSTLTVLAKTAKDKYQVLTLDENGEKGWEKEFSLKVKKSNNELLMWNKKSPKTLEIIKLDISGRAMKTRELDFDDEIEDFKLLALKDGGYAIFDLTENKLMLFDKTGKKEKNQPIDKMEKLFSFIQTKDNGFLFAGLAKRQSGSTGKELIVIKTNILGKELWYDLISNTTLSTAVQLRQMEDNTICLGEICQNQSCRLIEYSPDGKRNADFSSVPFEDVSKLLITSDKGLLIARQIQLNQNQRPNTQAIKLIK